MEKYNDESFTLTNFIINKIKDLDENTAILLKWKLIKNFVDENKMTSNNRKQIGIASLTLERKLSSDGSYLYGDSDPYCRSYYDLKTRDCKECPLYSENSGSCYDQYNPYYEYFQSIFTILEDFEHPNDPSFLPDDESSNEEKLINCLNDILEYLKNIIKNNIQDYNANIESDRLFKRITGKRAPGETSLKDYKS